MFALVKKLRRLSYTFCIPPLEVLVQRQLEEAERELLSAENAYDHAAATVEMFHERCERLRRQLTHIQESGKNQAK
ncbi:hypothetical protein FSY45_19405 [Comamonas sp. Z1]|uniref:hypothetical protein n=1 Tax=Comamonas sp. Z1 TaxID=2601246 RepID=UPI0011E88672|nr:hypothetical protein [Comamonas sp. Z1]TYK74333.1 hypothetical protein FSY45_19405 [Comamonas sp. Z1]